MLQCILDSRMLHCYFAPIIVRGRKATWSRRGRRTVIVDHLTSAVSSNDLVILPPPSCFLASNAAGLACLYGDFSAWWGHSSFIRAARGGPFTWSFYHSKRSSQKKSWMKSPVGGGISFPTENPSLIGSKSLLS